MLLTDSDGRRGYDSGNTGYGSTAGPHSSNLANKADPRVDSDRGMASLHLPRLFLKSM